MTNLRNKQNFKNIKTPSQKTSNTSYVNVEVTMSATSQKEWPTKIAILFHSRYKHHLLHCRHKGKYDNSEQR